jgi:quercetin dioxygenase-like cupin family protein
VLGVSINKNVREYSDYEGSRFDSNDLEEEKKMSDSQSRPEEPIAVVKHSESVEKVQVAAGSATQTQVLIGERDRAPNFAMRRFIMGPEGGMPRHTNSVEHEQYVLKGRAEVGIGEEVHQVTAGDVLLIPALEPHYYKVLEAPFEFLCVVPNLPDKITILDDNS